MSLMQAIRLVDEQFRAGNTVCPLEGYRADPEKILSQNPIEKSGYHAPPYELILR